MFVNVPQVREPAPETIVTRQAGGSVYLAAEWAQGSAKNVSCCAVVYDDLRTADNHMFSAQVRMVLVLMMHLRLLLLSSSEQSCGYVAWRATSANVHRVRANCFDSTEWLWNILQSMGRV